MKKGGEKGRRARRSRRGRWSRGLFEGRVRGLVSWGGDWEELWDERGRRRGI